jgi:hypothetical protein
MERTTDAASQDLPVVVVVGGETKDSGGKLNAVNAAAQLKAIRDEFLKVLNDRAESGAFALKEVDLSLTVSASGSIGWLTTKAEGSLELRFRPA